MKIIFVFLIIFFSSILIAAEDNYTRFWVNPGDSMIMGVAKNYQSVGIIKLYRPEKEKIIIEIFGKIKPKIYSDIKPLSAEKFLGDKIISKILFPENTGNLNFSICLPQKGWRVEQIFFGNIKNKNTALK